MNLLGNITQSCAATAPLAGSSELSRGRKDRLAAFTLIELLLAIAIFSVVLLSINTVFFAAMRLRQHAADALEESLPVDRALGVIRKDLLGAVPPGGTMSGAFRCGPGSTVDSSLTGMSGTQVGTSTTTTGAGMQVSGGLDFFTTTGILTDDAPWAEVQEVNYQLVDSRDGTNDLGKDLVRSVNRNLLAYSAQAAQTRRIAGNIADLEFAFYDGSQWRDSWDTTTGDTNLPRAVRVRLRMASTEGTDIRNDPIEMIVLVPRGSGT